MDYSRTPFRFNLLCFLLLSSFFISGLNSNALIPTATAVATGERLLNSYDKYMKFTTTQAPTTVGVSGQTNKKHKS